MSSLSAILRLLIKQPAVIVDNSRPSADHRRADLPISAVISGGKLAAINLLQ